MKFDFEKSLNRLEEIVQHLEQGDIPLEDSIKLFEEGIKLAKKCNEKLEKIEQKIKLIIGKEDNKIILQDFNDE